jgi:DNA-binding transcriptional regulator YhcF (GntR family)
LFHTRFPTRTAATSKPFWSGREGAVGGIVSQGYLPAFTRIMVKFGGPFVRLHVGKLNAAKTKSATLRNVFARYADCMLAQVFQSTACNAIHSIEQRTAKWIISAMERTNGEEAVPLTHEQLATMLGVGRSYASRVIQTFKAEGVLDTRRGSILMLNREALRIRACASKTTLKKCYAACIPPKRPTAVEVGATPQMGG